MAVEVEVKEDLVRFRDGERVAGEYVVNDPYKPYFRAVNTPAGHNLTLVSPADHRHHKGLMYALVASDVCWWEEDPGSGHCGIQDIKETEEIENGIRQKILWREESGGLLTYWETREISLHRKSEKAFEWHWRTRRESLRNHHLKKSVWSFALPDGRKINYHGLGIRLPWMWAFGGDDSPFNGVERNGTPCTPVEACGSNGRSVTWWGLMDGFWTPPKCALTIDQKQDFTWFVLKSDFPYLSVGPSNETELDINDGASLEESYTITVEDRHR